MPRHFSWVAVTTLCAVLSAAISGCSIDAQASQAVPQTAAAALPALASMPAPQAPFDETRITPVETAGASMTN